MSVICKNCGTELDDGVRFCRACGAKVEEQSAPVGIKAMFEAVTSAPEEPAEKSAFSPASAFEDIEEAPAPEKPQPLPPQPEPTPEPQPSPMPIPVPAGQPEPPQPAPAVQPAPVAVPPAAVQPPVQSPAPMPAPAQEEEEHTSTAAVVALVIIIMLIVGIIVFDVLYLTHVITLGKDAASVAGRFLPAVKAFSPGAL